MRFLRVYIAILLLSFSVFVTGCVSSEKPALQTVPGHVETIASAAIQNTPEFILSSGDTLRITVFGDDDLSGEYDIDTRGTITMPLIGDIQAGAKSVEEVQSKIITKLNDGYLVDPKVSIEVTSLRPFYILGEVNAPGSYPTVPQMDVFKAIATAGGLTPRAVKERYIIYRGFAENRVEIMADDQTPVLPGDSIKVKERFF